MNHESGVIIHHASLLVSLGQSPAIVPEAFLLPDAAFAGVHVLTTEQPDVTMIQRGFAERAPTVELTITRVAGFHDFRSEQDHQHFEEVLLRWFLDTGTRPEERWVCVAGGFKTMSAAMQKAASLLGAANVFHVLCTQQPQPSNPADIEAARAAGRLHWIRLGPESGWPRLRECTPRQFPLEVVRAENGVRWARAASHDLRERIRAVLDRSQSISRRWARLTELPFSELAAWPDPDFAWLAAPLDPESEVDRRWLAQAPKVELHCHLGGFATAGPELDQVRAAARFPERLPSTIPLDLPPGWPLPPRPVGLEAYRRLGDNNGTALLKDPGCLERQCHLLYRHLVSQRVAYAEIRCSPANYADPARGRSPWTVLQDIQAAFTEAMRSARTSLDPTAPPPCHVNLLLIGTRQERGDYRAHIARHLALALTAAEHVSDPGACRVAGVDLAGYEDPTTRAHYFRDEFVGIHRRGLALTVHAGENDDAEGIWRAVFDLNARRLGHALSLGESPDLLRSVVDRGLGLEMCPYANLQIRGYDLSPGPQTIPQRRYPLLDYLRAGAKVTVNTDNIGISAASLSDNLLLAARLCPGLTRLDVLQLQRNAAETAFLPANARRALLDQLAAALPKP